MDRAQLTDVTLVRNFVLAGNATFTLVSKRTGTRFTYRVATKVVDGPTPTETRNLYFVSVLTGPDNQNDYQFLGTIFDRDQYRHGRRSRITEDAVSARAWDWFWRMLRGGNLQEVEVWHEGRCGRCGRPLTVPESIAVGLGPVYQGLE